MARVIIGYSAEFTSTGYIYDYPNYESDHIQYDVGTPIELPSNYTSRMEGEFYPVSAPSGWVLYYEIGNIQPVYKTVTDAIQIGKFTQ